MESDEVRALIDGGERFTVEFKRGRAGVFNDHDLIEAVVCLANGDGGALLIGVEDDGTVTGAAPRHGAVTDPHRVRALILNMTEPPVATSVDVVEIDDHQVIAIDVPDMAFPVGTKSGKFVRRALRLDGTPECVPYPLQEMMSVGLVVQGRDYAETPARGATVGDLDPSEFERFRSFARTGRGDASLAEASDWDILRALRLSAPGAAEQLNLGAVLMFGSARALAEHIPTAEAVFTEMRLGRVTASETIRQPLLRTADRLRELIDVRNSEQELIWGLHRVGIRRVPEGVVREALANALVHRDYSERGPITVQLTEDVFRVQSPGGFPPGITLVNLLEDSKPRSPILAEAFKRAGLVDRAGRGVREMYDQLLRAGRGEPDYSESNDRAVVVTVQTSDADIETVRFVLEFEDSTGTVLSLLQLRIVHELRQLGPLSVAELVDGLSQSETAIRAQLARLAERGLVEVRGSGRNRRHHLSAAFYRLAQSSEYVRLQDTDPIQQERMVLAYVEQYGSITRRKAAELCRLSPDQARVLLRRLTEAGALKLRGERRGAHYVLGGQTKAAEQADS